MKLTYAQLEQQITKKLAPIYVLSGDELLIKNDALNLIRKAAKAAGFTERKRIAPEAKFDWESLHQQLFSTSLFAEKRLIEFDFRDSTPNKTAAAILQDYANRPSNDCIIVIDLAKTDIKITKSAWYQALEKSGMVIPIWPIPREQLPQWIHQRAKKYKLQINPDAANLLADFVEGNLIAAAQTLEKIYLLKPTSAVDVALVQAVLSDESQFTVFDFIDQLIAGHQAKTIHILEQLRESGTEPVLILWSITRELRMLTAMTSEVAEGQPIDFVMQKHRVFMKRQTAVRQFIKKNSHADCLKRLTHALHIDLMIKGGAPGNVWDALQIFTLRFQL